MRGTTVEVRHCTRCIGDWYYHDFNGEPLCQPSGTTPNKITHRRQRALPRLSVQMLDGADLLRILGKVYGIFADLGPIFMICLFFALYNSDKRSSSYTVRKESMYG